MGKEREQRENKKKKMEKECLKERNALGFSNRLFYLQDQMETKDQDLVHVSFLICF